jgi:MYXO-CTERM domain-containing protein
VGEQRVLGLLEPRVALETLIRDAGGDPEEAAIETMRRFVAARLTRLELPGCPVSDSFMPALAAGHAGEVHTEPAPKAEKAVVPPKDGKRAGSREAETATGDRAGDKGGAMSSGEGGSNDVAASQVSAETPPPPEVPQSNPGFHFLALGLVALLAAGFVVLRRRRAFG